MFTANYKQLQLQQAILDKRLIFDYAPVIVCCCGCLVYSFTASQPFLSLSLSATGACHVSLGALWMIKDNAMDIAASQLINTYTTR